MQHLLYSFRRCPYAMRARMALASAGCDPEIREVRLGDKPGHMLEISAKATVPVLQLDDGTVIDESLDIMRWALATGDPQDWLRNNDSACLNTLLETNDGPFKDALDRYKYPDRYAASDAASDAAYAKAVAALAPVETELSGKAFLDGNSPGFFDAAIFPFVRQFCAVDTEATDRLPYPCLLSWHAAMLDHGSFAQVMKKLPPWQVGDAPLSFTKSLNSALA